MAKTRDEEALRKGGSAGVYSVPVIAAAAVATPTPEDGPESLPCVLASPVLYDYSCPSILNSSFSDDGGSDGEGGVPLAAACCYPDPCSGSRDVIAQNVDLFDLNTTVHVEVAGQVRPHPSTGSSFCHPVECFYIPQVCEPVEPDEPQLDLTEEEAALLLDLMDKSMISPKAPVERKEESIAKAPSASDSAELDNIVLDIYFEDSEKYEQRQYQSRPRFEIPDTGPREVSPPPPVARYEHAPRGGASQGAGDGEGLVAAEASRAAAEGKKRKRDQGATPKPPRTAKQIATAKRARANGGQFVRCKIKWVPACALSNETFQGGS